MDKMETFSIRNKQCFVDDVMESFIVSNAIIIVFNVINIMMMIDDEEDNDDPTLIRNKMV